MALGRDLLFFLGIFALIIQLSLAEELENRRRGRCNRRPRPPGCPPGPPRPTPSPGPSCFQENVLFLENSDTTTTSAELCLQACQNEPTCKFWSWNSATNGCALRNYRPGGVIVVQGQRTGTRESVFPVENRTFVSLAFKLRGPRELCQKFCQRSRRAPCFSVTYNDETSDNPRVCVFNGGPTERTLPLPSGSGVSSAPKTCP